MTDKEIEALKQTAIAVQKLYNSGAFGVKDAALYTYVDGRVRARMARKGAKWTEARIRRKVRGRLAGRAILKIIGKQPFAPLAALAVTIDDAINSGIRAVKDDILNGRV